MVFAPGGRRQPSALLGARAGPSDGSAPGRVGLIAGEPSDPKRMDPGEDPSVPKHTLREAGRWDTVQLSMLRDKLSQQCSGGVNSELSSRSAPGPIETLKTHESNETFQEHPKACHQHHPHFANSRSACLRIGYLKRHLHYMKYPGPPEGESQ